MPHSTAGSLGPAFATARPVGLAVKPASALALVPALAKRGEPTFELLRYFLGGNRPSQTDRLTRSHARIHGFVVRQPDTQGWYLTDGSTAADAAVSQPPTYAAHE